MSTETKRLEPPIIDLTGDSESFEKLFEEQMKGRSLKEIAIYVWVLANDQFGKGIGYENDYIERFGRSSIQQANFNRVDHGN